MGLKNGFHVLHKKAANEKKETRGYAAIPLERDSLALCANCVQPTPRCSSTASREDHVASFLAFNEEQGIQLLMQMSHPVDMDEERPFEHLAGW
jgi:hypothetical protein